MTRHLEWGKREIFASSNRRVRKLERREGSVGEVDFKTFLGRISVASMG